MSFSRRYRQLRHRALIAYNKASALISSSLVGGEVRAVAACTTSTEVLVVAVNASATCTACALGDGGMSAGWVAHFGLWAFAFTALRRLGALASEILA